MWSSFSRNKLIGRDPPGLADKIGVKPTQPAFLDAGGSVSVSFGALHLNVKYPLPGMKLKHLKFFHLEKKYLNINGTQFPKTDFV